MTKPLRSFHIKPKNGDSKNISNYIPIQPTKKNRNIKQFKNAKYSFHIRKLLIELANINRVQFGFGDFHNLADHFHTLHGFNLLAQFDAWDQRSVN